MLSLPWFCHGHHNILFWQAGIGGSLRDVFGDCGFLLFYEMEVCLDDEASTDANEKKAMNSIDVQIVQGEDISLDRTVLDSKNEI